MTGRIPKKGGKTAAKDASKQGKRLNLNRTTIRDLSPKGEGPKGGPIANSDACRGQQLMGR